ncbi:MAG: hypothetical protein Q4P06_08945 [Actinomycetaceae bacterium]|nr:hypothetical protein [Actinomycetaceae bacterium]
MSENMDGSQQPESDAGFVAPGSQSQPGAQPDPDTRPQPRYGRLAKDEPGYVPGQSQPGYGGSQGQPGQPGVHSGPGYAQPGQPGQFGQSGPGYAQPGYGQPHPQAGQPNFYPGQPIPAGPGFTPPMTLPSRGLPITMIVAGAIMMLIVAPLVWIVATFLSLLGAVESGEITASKSVKTIEVDDLGIAGLVIYPANSDVACHLEKDQTVVEFESRQLSGQALTYSSDDVAPGTYDIVCKNLPENATMTAYDSALGAQGAKALGMGVLWGSLFGVLGLVLLIWGIVKLVKVNGRRREIMLKQMGY